MSETAVVNYKWAYPGKYPDVEDQFTVKWNDPEIGVHWPTTNPILSERDA
jgi:dTDP-4-dehydrorhamnose 3,5-epimerase